MSVFIGEALGSCSSYIVKLIIDLLSHNQPNQIIHTPIFWYVALYGFVMLTGALLFRVSGFTAVRYMPFMNRDIRVDFFTYLYRQSHRYFSDHF